MKAIILTWTGAQDHETIYPYYRLLGAGFDTQIATDKRDEQGRFYCYFGCNMPAHLLYDERDHWNIGHLDLLVLPGGVKAIEKLRLNAVALRLIGAYCREGGVIASTCHGAQLLISAKACKGHRIAAYPSIADDIENAGAEYSNDPVVVSGNIVSSPHYDHLGIWMETAIAEVGKRA